MRWSDFLSHLTRDFRLSEPELASISGMTYPTLNRIRRGITKRPNQNTIKRLEQGLNIKIDDSDPNNITYKKNEHRTETSNQPHHFEGELTVYEFPLLSIVYAGEPKMLFVDKFSEVAHFLYDKMDHKCFALRVSGSSMETTLSDGDVVLVDMDLIPQDGDLVAVKLKNGNQYIKRFKNENYAFIQLSSDNGNFGVRMIDKNDIDAIFPVVAIQIKIRDAEGRTKAR